MKSTMRRGVGSAFAATALLAGTMMATQGTAFAGTAGAQNCGTGSFYTVEKFGSPTYKPIAPTAGRYNSSKSKAKLNYTMTTTTSRATTWSAGATVSVSWGIAKVEGRTDYSVTKKTSKGIKVTNQMVVKGKHYGFVTPKVKFQRFNIRKERYGPGCKTVVIKNYGYMNAIVAYPFFSECQTKKSSGCTPKP
ncbi:hypothetical protein [Streptomyces sp. NPDC012510]|uniref:hypothetical protein n=1 Tax=Streptomyces sp. NPDC012510 TaxID=3364838 RepID=UPI0036F10B84